MPQGGHHKAKADPTGRRDVETRAPRRSSLAAQNRNYIMSIGTILLLVLVLFLIGALPIWPHSSKWGYYPSGGLGVPLVIVVVLLVMGRI